jgi:hypothetical protein
MERWARIKAVYQAALDKDPAARALFIRDACGEDVELLGEVESLLAYDQAAMRFSRPRRARSRHAVTAALRHSPDAR